MTDSKFIASEVSISALESVSGGYRPGGYYNPNHQNGTVFQSSPQALQPQPVVQPQQQQQSSGFDWGTTIGNFAGSLLQHSGGWSGLFNSIGGLFGGNTAHSTTTTVARPTTTTSTTNNTSSSVPGVDSTGLADENYWSS